MPEFYSSPLSSTSDKEAMPGVNDLCAKCASIDINAFFDSPYDERRRIDLRYPSNDNGRIRESCALCGLVDDVRAALGCDPSRTLHLCSYEYTRFSALENKPAVLGVVDPKSVLYGMQLLVSTTTPDFISKSRTLRGRVIQPDRIDYDIIQEWMHHCRSKHKSTCAVEAPGRASSMKIINCSSRRLVRASDHDPYVALSYVWGQGTQDRSTWDPQSDVLPTYLPKTVEDAIIVTKALGFEYLWVDKYCINQSNSKELVDQVQQMDLIYGNAELTIVAASGDNSEAGLPGVSSVERTPQPSARVGKHTLVSLMIDPRQATHFSTWMSRGWTFQEALLSRRLLIFLRDQVYFECHATNLCETMDLIDDDNTHNKFWLQMQHWGPCSQMVYHLADYSRRNLTNEDDALNAFLGVLRSYGRRNNMTVCHHWGVPILPLVTNRSSEFPTLDGFIKGLCWTHLAAGHRRVAFPSWSWAGWDITVSTPTREYSDYYEFQVYKEIDVFIGDGSPNVLPEDTVWTHPSHGPSWSASIHLSVYTLPLRLLDLVESPNRILPGLQGWVEFDANEQRHVQAELYLLPKAVSYSDLQEFTKKKFRGLVLGTTQESLSPGNLEYFIMVIQDLGGYFERVGHLRLGDRSTRCVDKVSGEVLSSKLDREIIITCLAHQERKLICLR